MFPLGDLNGGLDAGALAGGRVGLINGGVVGSLAGGPIGLNNGGLDTGDLTGGLESDDGGEIARGADATYPWRLNVAETVEISWIFMLVHNKSACTSPGQRPHKEELFRATLQESIPTRFAFPEELTMKYLPLHSSCITKGVRHVLQIRSYWPLRTSSSTNTDDD
jgi:hypothetical protein